MPLLLLVALCGCSTVRPAKRYGNTQLESLKTAYIVWAAGLDRTIESYAKEALETHGVKVSTGPRQEKPADVDFYVECEPHWWWDLVVYLTRLDIRLIDNKTGQVFAIGQFHNSFFHTYPDPREKTIEVINSIYSSTH